MRERQRRLDHRRTSFGRDLPVILAENQMLVKEEDVVGEICYSLLSSLPVIDLLP